MYQETDMERNFTQRNYRILSHATFAIECINKSVDYKYNTEQIALFSVNQRRWNLVANNWKSSLL